MMGLRIWESTYAEGNCGDYRRRTRNSRTKLNANVNAAPKTVALAA
jgi:hypothetical protein